ncbi:hypothetical protein E3P99_01432 [Wallemia hederae]|uniref:GDP/GTP exchange factor Sec2 N-terminal domain-containing protein n=1 Tax=Wallemia hederae TaxID=1540922 RepID=A0A4T0FR09_9BASI|nr:hypothetical protein E3P99_01432 [Wallemia hederae]
MENSISTPSLIDKGEDAHLHLHNHSGEIHDTQGVHSNELNDDDDDDEDASFSSTHQDAHVLPDPVPHSQPEQLQEEEAQYTKRTSSKIQSARPTSLLVNDLDATAARGAAEPHALVIASLRAQIDELTSQLNSLNAKLVLSFDKCDTLEYDLDATHQNTARLESYIAQLEKEKALVKQNLDNGTLVERENVMHELTRMVDSIVTETQKATLARQDKAAIEQDLDDLSANLFGEANRMVGVERLLKAQEIERRKVAEERLAEAEEAVRLTQQQMNGWVERAERAEKGITNGTSSTAVTTVTNTTTHPTSSFIPLSLTNTHIPYLEFQSYLNTLANLITIRQSQAKETALPPLDLGHPFLRRVLEEDIEPTLRLDLSRAFGLLTRGKVLSAIVEGSFELEPAAKNEFGGGTECALSGRLLIPETNAMHKSNSSQSSSIFGFRSNRSITSMPPPPTRRCDNIFVFRLSTAPNATRYPVDPVWALPRLRATCEFWRFVRSLQSSVICLDGPFKPPIECQTLKNVGYGGVSDVAPASASTAAVGDDKRATKSFWGSFGRSSSQPASPSPLSNPPVALPDVEAEGKKEGVDGLNGVMTDATDAVGTEKEGHKEEQKEEHKEQNKETNKEAEQVSDAKPEEQTSNADEKATPSSENANDKVNEDNTTVMSEPQQPPPKPKRGKKGRGRKGTVTGAPPPIPTEQPPVPAVPTASDEKNEEKEVEDKLEEKTDESVVQEKTDEVEKPLMTSDQANSLDLRLNDKTTPSAPVESWEAARWRQVLELKHNMFWARVNGDANADTTDATETVNASANANSNDE